MSNKKYRAMDQKVLNNEDLERLRSFLKQNSLPYEDIRLEGNDFFLYLDGEEVVGCGGLEYYGDHGLLRSVAVAKELRGEGFGKKIVEELISRAKDRPVSTVSLLTETAPAFFGKLGFKKQSREDAQKEIKSSSEFSSVCPVSAVLMVMEF